MEATTGSRVTHANVTDSSMDLLASGQQQRAAVADGKENDFADAGGVGGGHHLVNGDNAVHRR